MTSVFVVVEWIDGIPEALRVYAKQDAAEQYVRVIGRKHVSVLEMEVYQ